MSEQPRPTFLTGPSDTSKVKPAGEPTMVITRPDRPQLLQRLESTEEEQQMLNLLLYDTDGVLLRLPQLPKASWFSTPHHQRVYLGWKALFEAGMPVTPDAVLRTLREQAKPDELEAVHASFDRVLSSAATDAPENLAYALRTAAQCRRFSAMINSLNSGFHRNEPIDELWHKAAFELAQADDHESFLPFQEQLKLTLQHILKPDLSNLGLLTKLDQIDMLCGGLEPAQMYVMAGMQGSGKTALYLEIIMRLLEFYPDVAVCILSLEMHQARLQSRLLANLSYVDVRRQRDHAKPGQIPLADWEIEALTKAAERMSAWQDRVEMHFRAMGTTDIKEVARKFALKHRGKRKVLICDHIGLVRRSGNDVRVGIMDTIQALKDVATEHDYAVIPLAQMIKELESKLKYGATFHRPDQSFIAEAGFINQTADTILCTWRPEMYVESMPMTLPNGVLDHDWDTKGKMILVTGKNRDGEMNKELLLGCNMRFMQIYNLEEQAKHELLLPKT
jgi:replicative DNA helicase